MAGFTGASPIVTDGLVFAVDAANYESYPGSGTTWTDLAGTSNGTLTNGPTFDSGNGGSIVFDGTNDLVDFGNILNLGTQDMTISSWVKLTSNPSGFISIVSKSYAGGGNRYFMGADGDKKICLLIAEDSPPTSVIPLGTTVLSLDTWYFITGVWDRSGNASIYINDTAETVTNADISAYSGDDITDNTIPFRIGSYAGNDKSSPLLLWPGNIATTMLYFRTLSSIEVTQNYNALKSRFGL